MSCTYHCSNCGSHFSSLAAFDAHRVGDYATGRFCEEPLDLDTLAPKSESGCCRIGAAVPKIGVTVWALARDLDRSQERPFELVGEPSGAVGGAA